MTFSDTPDWMSGVYSPQLLVGQFNAGSTSGTVTLPPNTESILIIGSNKFVSTVAGATTGVDYPVIYPNEFVTQIGIAMVSPVVDDELTITLLSASSTAWYVVADAGVRTVVDPVLYSMIVAAVGGQPSPKSALLVAGQEFVSGGDQAFPLLVDSSGRLLPPPAVTLAGSTFANGATVLAAPTVGAYYISQVQAVGPAVDYAFLNEAGGLIGFKVGATPDLETTNFVPPIRVPGAITYGAGTVNQAITIVVHGYTGP